MPPISQELQQASEILEQAGVAEPRREASLLLEYAIGKNRTFLIAHPEYELTNEETERFTSFIHRRANHEPFHYIVGVKEFYGLEFIVTPDVLIPRPETEMLVAAAVEILDSFAAPAFCEVGTGSGCIAVSVLYNVPSATAIGLDVSEKATAVSRANAEKHLESGRLDLRISDVFSGIGDEKFDLIVSNPPYIPNEDMPGLQTEVGNFEPHLALTDGGSGLSIIEKIVDASPRFLRPQGWLLMEIGIGQENDVKALFDKTIWEYVVVEPDFQSIPRMVRARMKL